MAKRYMIVLLLLGLLIPIPVAKGITTNNGVVLSLIKPAGGGDFTTLQAWENWADDQTNAAQWAECYSGGDLGAVTINGWVSTSSPTAYPRIYVPYSERHKGKDDGTGAGIVLSNDVCAVRNYIPYTRVEGLRIEQTVLANTDITVMHAITGVILDSNLIIYNITNTISGGTSAAFRFWTLSDTNGTFTARNNIVFGKKQVRGLYQGFNLLVSSPYTNTVLIYNNTMEQLDLSGFRFSGDGMILTLENNISMDSQGFGGTKLGYMIGSTVLSTNFNNNMSSDGTATNFGGTSNLVNMISSNQFVNTNSDWNLLSTANAKDAGKTESSFNWDAVGTIRVSPWDMGAMEIAYTGLWTYTSIANGYWTNNATWTSSPAGGTYPNASNDLATITNNVTLDRPYTAISNLTISGISGVTGTLTIAATLTNASPIAMTGYGMVTCARPYSLFQTGNITFTGTNVLDDALESLIWMSGQFISTTNTAKIIKWGRAQYSGGLNLLAPSPNFHGTIHDQEGSLRVLTNGCLGDGSVIMDQTHDINNEGTALTIAYHQTNSAGPNITFLDNAALGFGDYGVAAIINWTNDPTASFSGAQLIYGYHGGMSYYNNVVVVGTCTVYAIYYDTSFLGDVSGVGKIHLQQIAGWAQHSYLRGTNNTFTGGLEVEGAGYVTQAPNATSFGAIGKGPISVWDSSTLYLQDDDGATNWTLTNALSGKGTIRVEDATYRLTTQSNSVSPGLVNGDAGVLTINGKFEFAQSTLRLDVTSTSLIAGTGYDQLNVSAGDVTFASSITNCVLIVDCHSNALSSVRRTIISASGANFAPYVFSSVVLSNTVGSVTVEYVNGSINLYTAEAVGVARNKLIPQYDNNLTVKNSLWP